MMHREYLKLLFALTLLMALATTGSAQIPLSDSTSLLLERSYRFFDSPVNPDWYLIRPGDQFRATFIGARISPITYTVDPEGHIVDQSLGVVDLSGTTLTEARERLHGALSLHFTVEDIDISVVGPRRVSVTISGAVAEPGLYLGFTSQHVSEMIEAAGGILADGSHRNIRFESSRDTLRVDLDRAHFLGDSEFDPPLYAGTHIYVPGKSTKVVHVVGEVVSPRDIEFVQGDKLPDLLLMAGGILPLADTTHIQVTSIGDHDGAKRRTLQAGDVINVPRLEQSELTASVKLFGAVTKPGIYALDQGEQLAALIQQAGGFTSEANKSRTTIFRQIYSDPYQQAGGSRYAIAVGSGDYSGFEGTVLMAGDSVFVPGLLHFVRVRGAVSNPSYVSYKEGQAASYYIDACGGFEPDADRTWISIYNRVAGLASLHSAQVVVRDGDEIEVRRQETTR